MEVRHIYCQVKSSWCQLLFLLENGSGPYAASNITYLLTFYGNEGTLVSYKCEMLYLLPKTLPRIRLNETEIMKSK